MKKYLLLFCFLAYGCGSQIVSDKDSTIEQESASQNVNAEVDADYLFALNKPNEGYYIYPDNDRSFYSYLWHDDKKLLEEDVVSYLGYEWDPDDGPWIFADVFSELERDGKINLYLKMSRECGGCIWLDDHFFGLNPIDDSIRLYALNDINKFSYTGRGVPLDWLVLSPDKTKFAFVYADSSDYFSNQSVWVYDLVDQEWNWVEDVPEGKSVLLQTMASPVYDNALYWDENGELIIAPVSSESEELFGDQTE
ncbi:MAG: hypothetical protein ABIH78_00785 [Candidatus Peregrinibacteria bacterium]